MKNHLLRYLLILTLLLSSLCSSASPNNHKLEQLKAVYRVDMRKRGIVSGPMIELRRGALILGVGYKSGSLRGEYLEVYEFKLGVKADRKLTIGLTEKVSLKSSFKMRSRCNCLGGFMSLKLTRDLRGIYKFYPSLNHDSSKSTQVVKLLKSLRARGSTVSVGYKWVLRREGNTSSVSSFPILTMNFKF